MSDSVDAITVCNPIVVLGSVEAAEVLNDDEQVLSCKGGMGAGKQVLINGVITILDEPQRSDDGAVR